MKLYATITSERATKGQGGNNFIDAAFTVDEKTVLTVSIELEHMKKGEPYNVIVKDGKGFEVYGELIETIKGEKQKGDNRCELCKRLNSSTCLHPL